MAKFTATLVVPIEPDVYEALRQRAAQDDRTIAGFVRLLVREALAAVQQGDGR